MFMNCAEKARLLYSKYGQRKSMGEANPEDTKKPFFFLHRTFLGEQDLLTIFNTKRCRYNCHFCSLPSTSSPSWISEDDIVTQFEYVLSELQHSLSVLDRVTISNNGSVLDNETMPTRALIRMSRCIRELRRVRTLVLETRLEFVDCKVIGRIKEANSRARITILTGFETLDPFIRDEVLGKRESLNIFQEGLDRVAECEADLTAFVLFKPSQTMSDSEAFIEADSAVRYLVDQCKKRGIDLTVRINLMYAARGTKWARAAFSTPEYKPPRLSDVLKFAREKSKQGIRIYIGLSTEDLDCDKGSYRFRDDYSQELLKRAILFNQEKSNMWSN